MAAGPEEDTGGADEELAKYEVDIERSMEIKKIFNFQINKEAEAALAKRTRTEDDIRIIFQLATGMQAFDKLAKYHRIELCKVFRYKRYLPNDCIFREGDEPDGYYFILSGQVVGRKSGDDSKIERLKGLEQISQDIFTLRAGNGFGEGAMQSTGERGKRGATIVCEVAVEVLKVDLQDYNNVLSYIMQKQLEEKVEFLSRMPLWSGVSNTVLTTIAKCMSNVDVSPDRAIIQQGVDEPDLAFYIVKAGEFKVVKEMPVPTPKREGSDTRIVMQNKLLHVASLGPGDYFGELALIETARRTASVISASKGELYKLPKTEFDKYVKVPAIKVMEVLVRVASTYPSDEALLQAYEEQRSWVQYKKRLVRQVMADKRGRKDLNRMIARSHF